MPINGKEFVEIINEMISLFQEYEGGFVRIITLVVCVIVIAVLNHKDTGKVCVPVALCIVMLFAPHLYVYLYQDTSYKRFLWILPEAILFSYTIILLVSSVQKNVIKLAIVTIVPIVLFFTGTSIYSSEAGLFRTSDNLMQIDQTIVDLSNAIVSIDANPTCVIPYQAIEMIRVAEPNIIQVAGRNYYGYMGHADPLVTNLVSSVSSERPDSDFIFSLASSRRIKFVVTMAFTEIDYDISSQYGYEDLGVVGDYRLFYNPEPSPRIIEWYVTQYGKNWGQNYFYTLEDSDGNLVIIDGGCIVNAEILESIIRDHDYHISVWIITSLKNNHIGSAYEIIGDNSDIVTIDQIYIQQWSDNMLDEIYDHQLEWETQSLEIADDFVELINQYDNVVYLNEDENYDILGLNLHIYHTWDESVELIGNREASNSSMVFSISGIENSILFTSDTTGAIQNSIFESIGDDQFSYISVNDYGEWVYDYEWYTSRNPIGVFIDNESNQIHPGGRANAFYSYAVEMGYNVYTFETVPNRITIR